MEQECADVEYETCKENTQLESRNGSNTVSGQGAQGRSSLERWHLLKSRDWYESPLEVMPWWAVSIRAWFSARSRVCA